MVNSKKRFCSYYTNNNEIVEFMVNNINAKKTILEPCGGEGAFIDQIIKLNKNAKIDTLDSNPEAVQKLKDKFSTYKNINIWEGDTLFDKNLDSKIEYYDSIIGNPPYGVWQSVERRNELKNKYPNCYVKESYTMFMIRCLNLLKNNGKLSFIIPDTFLYLHRHEKLRKFLLETTSINDILIFPSKLFPGVNFGYAKLCIINLTKEVNDKNIINIYLDIKESSDFIEITKEKIHPKKVFQNEVLYRKNYLFDITADGNILHEVKNKSVEFSEVVNCVTGIYTGDNKKFIRRKNKEVKNSKGYLDVDNLKKYIPIVKGTSNFPYINEDNWFIDWSKEAINYYKTDKKARFQNDKYYFKKGIAYPMVKSSNSKAILMENRVFDQSIVGVFPKKDEDIYYILGFMNTQIFKKMLNAINPSANGSANYIKKIPYIIPDNKTYEKVSNLVIEILEDFKLIQINQIEIDKLIEDLYI